MNLQLSNRRQDLPVRLGTHGYRLDGDFAFLNAELHIPPYFSGSNFGLELWACPAPHSGGIPEGVKVAEISLELPTPIGPHVHRVEARATANPPPGSAAHAMVLVLVANTGDAPRIHDFANYGRLEHFDNPHFDGAVGYALDGDQVILNAAAVANPRREGNSSGTLCLELWALSEPYFGGAPRGHRLAGAELGSVFGQFRLPAIERRAVFAPPAPGRWHVSLLLREWTVASGYTTRDYRNFDVVYEQAAPEAAPVVATAQPATAPAPAPSARNADKLRLIKPAPEAASAAAESESTSVGVTESVAGAADAAESAKASQAAAGPATDPLAAAPAASQPGTEAPAAVSAPAVAPISAVATLEAAASEPAPPAAAVASAAVASASVASASVPSASVPSASVPSASVPSASVKSAGVSVNTASVEEISRLPGLTIKIAKELVKSRPFASLDALLDVRGIGDKTLRRIKGFITL
jgi:DNA uptake protein ComE-like DNA-binding protein